MKLLFVVSAGHACTNLLGHDLKTYLIKMMVKVILSNVDKGT